MKIKDTLLFFAIICLCTINQTTCFTQTSIKNDHFSPFDNEFNSLNDLARTAENLTLVQRLLEENVSTPIEKAQLFAWQGTYYRRNEAYELALEKFFKAYHIFSTKADSSFICYTNYEIGEVYRILKNKEKALHYLKIAETQAKTLKIERYIAYTQNALGILNFEQGAYDKALEYLIPLRESLLKKNSTDENLYFSNSNIGLAYIFSGKPNKGLKILVELYENSVQQMDSIEYSTECGNIAFAYEKTGAITLALMYYDSSIYYADLFKQYKVASITCQDLSNCYLGIGDSKKALEAYKKYHYYENLALSESTKHRISELEVAFDTEKKERALTKAQNQIKELDHLAQIRLQQNILIFAGLILLLLITLSIYFRAKENLKKRKIEEDLVIAELKSIQLEAENLKQKLENKKADLTAIALNIDRKNNFQTKLIQQLEALAKTPDTNIQQQTQDIITFCNTQLAVNEKLSFQQQNIKEVNHAFFQKLEKQFGKFTANEKYLAGSFRLGLSNKEIATQKAVSVNSVKMGRYRLRKKLQLEETVDLVDFLQKI